MTVVSNRNETSGGLFSGPPRYQADTPWGPWSALAAVVLIFAGQLLGVLAALGLIQAISKTAVTAADATSLTTPLGVAIMIGSQITSIAIVWMLAGRANMRQQVLQLLPPKATLATGLVGGLLVVALTGVIELILYQLLKFDYRADTQMIADGLKSPMWWGTVLMAVVFAPLWEELTFRGFLLSALAKTRLGFWPAALVCNALWTSLHAQYSLAGIVSVFTAGLVLSWLVWRTGSIRAPIIAHGVANLFAVGFAYWMTMPVTP
jgi:uncharacterized protein